MAGKRVDPNARAKHGPEEDRAHHANEDRGARTTARLRVKQERPAIEEGMTASDASRFRTFMGRGR